MAQPDHIDRSAEAAVVAQLVDVRDAGVAMAQLRKALNDLDASRVMDAIDSLVACGVVRMERGRVLPTAALERLDLLGMVAI